MRKLFISLAITGCLWPLTALSLGLGALHVQSALNEPLYAELDLVELGNIPIDELNVSLAPDQAYTSFGMERSYVLGQLKFKATRKANGTAVIAVTTTQPVSEPFVDVLVQMKWGGGQVIRDYTLLLDPPNYLPPPVYSETTSTTPEKAASVNKNSFSEKTHATTRVVHDIKGANTSTVQTHSGEMLWMIAKRVRPSSTVTLEQVMVAITAKNPQAFSHGNMNQLIPNRIIYVPTLNEVQAFSPSEAKTIYQQHTQAWRAHASLPESARVQLKTINPEQSPESIAINDTTTPTTESLAPMIAPPAASETTTTATTTNTRIENASAKNSEGEVPDYLKHKAVERTEAAAPEVASSPSLPLPTNESSTSTSADFSENPVTAPPQIQREMALLAEALRATKQTNALLQQQLDKFKLELAKRDATVKELQQQVQQLQTNQTKNADRTTLSAVTRSVSTPPEFSWATFWQHPYYLILLISNIAAFTWIGFTLGRRRSHPVSTQPAKAESVSSSSTKNVSSTSTRPSYAERVQPRKSVLKNEASETSSTQDKQNMPRRFSERPHTSSEKITPTVSATPSAAPKETPAPVIEPAVEAVAPPSPSSVEARNVDPLEEASVYLSYQRYDEAIGVLKNALEANTQRIEFWLKLLEAYALKKDAKNFKECWQNFLPYVPLLTESQNQQLEMWKKTLNLDVEHEQEELHADRVLVEDTRDSHVIEFKLDDTSKNLSVKKTKESKSTSEPVEVKTATEAKKTAKVEEVKIEEIEISLMESDDSIDAVPEISLIENDKESSAAASHVIENNENVMEGAENEVAGEDVLGTMLDLARVYMDMGDREGAKSLLDKVMQQGSDTQQQEALKLIERMIRPSSSSGSSDSPLH